MPTYQGIFSGASSALTWSLASLASDTNLLAGRASSAYDLTANVGATGVPPDDAGVAGQIMTGTSPTAARQIEIWAYGSMYDGPVYPDSITGSDAAKTMTNADLKGWALRNVAFIGTSSTSNVPYQFSIVSVKRLFLGFLPKYFGLFCVHNTGVALNATGGNHFAYVTPQVRVAA